MNVKVDISTASAASTNLDRDSKFFLVEILVGNLLLGIDDVGVHRPLCKLSWT